MISKIQKLIDEIHDGNTGSPKQISIKFKVSERMVYRYIDIIKNEFNAPVKYCRIKQTYYFETKGKLDLRWKKNEKNPDFN
jgi:transcriptional antiterminator